MHKFDKSIELIKHKENREDDDESNNDGMVENFDARNKWFECTSISHVWNQGNCAADWVNIFYNILFFNKRISYLCIRYVLEVS